MSKDYPYCNPRATEPCICMMCGLDCTNSLDNAHIHGTLKRKDNMEIVLCENCVNSALTMCQSVIVAQEYVRSMKQASPN